MQRLFDHEKLEVYQTSLALIVWLEPILTITIMRTVTITTIQEVGES
jgi:hypothetical protein